LGAKTCHKLRRTVARLGLAVTRQKGKKEHSIYAI
jgi:hypothetical protein